jgi:hypothetical protein
MREEQRGCVDNILVLTLSEQNVQKGVRDEDAAL